jgi:hypothetical protein
VPDAWLRDLLSYNRIVRERRQMVLLDSLPELFKDSAIGLYHRVISPRYAGRKHSSKHRGLLYEHHAFSRAPCRKRGRDTCGSSANNDNIVLRRGSRRR